MGKKNKKTHTETLEKSGVPEAEASWGIFNATAAAELHISASVATASAMGFQFGIYIGRSIFSGAMLSAGLIQSEGFGLLHKISSSMVENKAFHHEAGIADMNVTALKSEIKGLENKLDAIDTRIGVLSNHV